MNIPRLLDYILNNYVYLYILYTLVDSNQTKLAEQVVHQQSYWKFGISSREDYIPPSLARPASSMRGVQVQLRIPAIFGDFCCFAL